MNKALFVLLILFFKLNISFSQYLPTPITFEIGYCDSMPVVDAVNDDFTWGEEIPFMYTFQTEMPEEEDLSAYLQIAWNESGLFMYIQVIDEFEKFLEDGGNTWEYDCIEIFFYFGNDFGPEAKETEVEGDSLYSQIRLQLTDDYEVATDGRFQGEWGAAPLGLAENGEMEAFLQTTGSVYVYDGYDLEVIFPWDMFAMLNDPVENMEFGFEIIIQDGDETSHSYQLSLLNDSGDDQAWDNKAYLNTAKLSSATACNCAPDNVNSNILNNKFITPTIVSDQLYLKNVSFIEIINISGQVLLHANNPGGSLDVSWLKKGIYFVRTNEKYITKIIKQ